MGTDGAPTAEIAGVIEAIKESGTESGSADLSIVLVGDEPRLRPLFEVRAAGSGEVARRVEIRHAPEVITMDDAPSIVVKHKKQSSMRVCFDLVKAGEVDAVVSAGNSGAMLACGLFVAGRLPGVDRPAIVTTFPTMRGPCALLDMGANVDTKAAVLAQFAVMGAVYARLQQQSKTQRPRVGLLSNGAEEHKGTTLTRETHRLLERANQPGGAGASFDYVGYVEGRDIFKGNADVVVTDGFTGNVLLKGCEGLVEALFFMARREIAESSPLVRLGALLMKPALRKLKKRTDYAETGGAPLLGVDGVVMLCHGRSNARAIKNAILEARDFSSSALGRELTAEIARHEFIWKAAETRGDA